MRARARAQILPVTFYYPYGLAYRAALDSEKVYGILHPLMSNLVFDDTFNQLYTLLGTLGNYSLIHTYV